MARPGHGRVNRETGEVEWHRRPRRVRRRAGFPFYSMSLSVAPEDVPLTQELLRAHGLSAEFDADGCPKIESAVQHRKIAQALGLFSGRDGYGHQSVSGRHENSGARPGAGFGRGAGSGGSAAAGIGGDAGGCGVVAGGRGCQEACVGAGTATLGTKGTRGTGLTGRW